MLGPGWSDKPPVKAEVKVTSRRWSIRVKIDARTRAGRKFWWVSKGTGIWGPKHNVYLIRPRRARALRFKVPNRPKTLPAGSQAKRLGAVTPQGETEIVYSNRVVATGIRPRLFHERLQARYNNRQWTGGFCRRSENAARRGLRKKFYVTV